MAKKPDTAKPRHVLFTTGDATNVIATLTTDGDLKGSVTVAGWVPETDPNAVGLAVHLQHAQGAARRHQARIAKNTKISTTKTAEAYPMEKAVIRRERDRAKATGGTISGQQMLDIIQKEIPGPWPSIRTIYKLMREAGVLLKVPKK